MITSFKRRIHLLKEIFFPARQVRYLCDYRLPGGYKRIYHYHNRKTGGTSLNHILLSTGGEDSSKVFNRLSSSDIHRTISKDKVFTAWNKYLINQGKYFYAFSHIPSHELILQPDTFTVTCLRDPAKRIISHYRMLLEMQAGKSKHPAYLRDGKYLGNNIIDFVNNLPKERLFQQLHMFSKNFDVSEAATNIRNCTYYFFTNNFSEGINDLSEMLNLELKSIHIRKSSIAVDITEEDRVKIKEKMISEYELFDKLKKS